MSNVGDSASYVKRNNRMLEPVLHRVFGVFPDLVPIARVGAVAHDPTATGPADAVAQNDWDFDCPSPFVTIGISWRGDGR
jgi:hypothetical protein